MIKASNDGNTVDVARDVDPHKISFWQKLEPASNKFRIQIYGEIYNNFLSKKSFRQLLTWLAGAGNFRSYKISWSQLQHFLVPVVNLELNFDEAD